MLHWRLPVHQADPENARRATEALAAVELESEALTFPRALSGGMARRVALARAMVVRPRLMLLDEPFSSLDAATAASLHGVASSLWRANQITVVLVTHDLSEAFRLADRVIRLAGKPASIAAIVTFDTPPGGRNDVWKRETLSGLDQSS